MDAAMSSGSPLSGMTFRNSHHSYTPAIVQREAPPCSGVYGLSNSRQWIYIGETDDIRSMLLRHLDGRDTSASFPDATGFTFELCAPEDRVTRQDRLVFELEPVRNRRL